ncbi:MAG: LuxR C-terminal-related transcriptional regulator [Proteobacteria bacterium]|nr:LuxR C-terminal-related transcriptional regulator [Pseudomonadota bacterium]
MKRVRQRDSLHGTASGQVSLPASLRERFGLTVREAACAALLARGVSAAEVARRLEISGSTTAKHLGALRRKLGVGTTAEAAVTLARLTPPEWAEPPPPASTRYPPASPALTPGARDFAHRLAAAGSLRRILEMLVDHLAPLQVGGLLYAFLPLGVASLRSRDFIECNVGPESVVRAQEQTGGAAESPLARDLYVDPERVLFIDGAAPRDVGPRLVHAPLLRALLEAGFRYGITLGAPFGPGFVAVSALITAEAPPDLADRREEVAEEIRSGLLLAQSAAFSFGALAASAGLTLRERDALSLLAQGRTARSAAAELGIGERAMGQLVQAARRKLRAGTTHEALCKAMALNALVFL